jgi:hypothetical protein
MVLKTSDIIGHYGKAPRKFNKIEIFIRASAPAIACWFGVTPKRTSPRFRNYKAMESAMLFSRGTA